MSTDQFIGTWKLVSCEVKVEGGESVFPMGQVPVGRLMYDEKDNMLVALANAERPRMSNDVHKMFAPLEEKGPAFDSFEAYFGSYSVNETEKVITHHVESGLFPNWTGSSQQRFYSFTGNRLELSTPPVEHEGSRVVAVLLWERM
uniref:Lipocalin-like domain-containing protein n=1 Tax=Candidatus Kentrum sp. DK TaxID=2126562 RepID=A0A450T7F1_9GAMM|nr:MAG: Lipocalin-like domain-containing protein [Candidatus Kentron sp. DK]VFJ62644.1 MAG: Lipocalin-like domain-containing protein [Candidatus Kentron sp. DK]